LPPAFRYLRHLPEARVGKRGKRQIIWVLRLLEVATKKVVAAAVAGATVIVWGAAILFNKVDDHARRITKLEGTNDGVRRDAPRISEQMARIDERLADARQKLEA
jgi:hypothetical protein